MKVVILCGQDPLLFMLASSPLPEISELDIAGGLRGEPIDVVRGPYTGFPIPADCEIAIEGETVPGQVQPRGAVRRMDGLLLGRHGAAAVCQREDHPLSQRSDPVLRAAAQAGRRDRAAQGHRRRGADLARARRLRSAGRAGRVEPRGRAGDALHRDPDPPALSRPRAQGAARGGHCQGGAYAGQVDRGGRRRHRRRRARPGAVGDVHAVRSGDRHRPDPEGLGLEARSALSAGQLQQPHPDRRLHSVRQEARRTRSRPWSTSARICGRS